MIFESLGGMTSSILGNMLKNIYFLSLITFHKEASVKCFGLFFYGILNVIACYPSLLMICLIHTYKLYFRNHPFLV